MELDPADENRGITKEHIEIAAARVAQRMGAEQGMVDPDHGFLMNRVAKLVVILVMIGVALATFMIGFAVGRESGLAESPFRVPCVNDRSVSCHWDGDPKADDPGSYVVDRSGRTYYLESGR